jgi:lysozyme
MKKIVFILSLLLCPILSAQVTSPVGVKLIKHFEQFRAKAYSDPAGIITVGWGDTKNVHIGMVITEQQADVRLAKDLIDFESYVKRSTSRPLAWNEFDALVSFSYNAGYRITGELRTAVNNGTTNIVIYRLKQVDKAKVRGRLVVLAGLVTRRLSESILYQRAVLNF